METNKKYFRPQREVVKLSHGEQSVLNPPLNVFFPYFLQARLNKGQKQDPIWLEIEKI